MIFFMLIECGMTYRPLVESACTETFLEMLTNGMILDYYLLFCYEPVNVEISLLNPFVDSLGKYALTRSFYYMLYNR